MRKQLIVLTVLFVAAALIGGSQLALISYNIEIYGYIDKGKTVLSFTGPSSFGWSAIYLSSSIGVPVQREGYINGASVHLGAVEAASPHPGVVPDNKMLVKIIIARTCGTNANVPVSPIVFGQKMVTLRGGSGNWFDFTMNQVGDLPTRVSYKLRLCLFVMVDLNDDGKGMTFRMFYDPWDAESPVDRFGIKILGQNEFPRPGTPGGTPPGGGGCIRASTPCPVGYPIAYV